jgi:hypothetical protein
MALLYAKTSAPELTDALIVELRLKIPYTYSTWQESFYVDLH